MPKRKTIEVGSRFGRLVVVSPGRKRNGKFHSDCACDCGRSVMIRQTYLRNGHSRSCGCLRDDSTRRRVTTHGMAGTKIYGRWFNMLRRCNSPTDPGWERYGGRGITVCERWLSFDGFYADMGDAPSGKSLDRIDNSKGYSPENCRWASQQEQARNTRRNRRITHDGRTMLLCEWAEFLGIPMNILGWRLSVGGWEPPRALDTPYVARK